jgi:hypothetical protein
MKWAAIKESVRRHWNEWAGVLLGVVLLTVALVAVQAYTTNQRFKPVQERWDKMKAESAKH